MGTGYGEVLTKVLTNSSQWREWFTTEVTKKSDWLRSQNCSGFYTTVDAVPEPLRYPTLAILDLSLHSNLIPIFIYQDQIMELIFVEKPSELDVEDRSV